MEGTIPVISPSRPVNNPINDNYCLVDPQLKLSVEDPICQDLNRTVNKTVNLCCWSCTLCNRAVRKQRHKSQSGSNRNKVCETCLLCKSLSLCSNCSKCPSCCRKSTCGGQAAKVLAGLALPGCKHKSSFNSSGRVQPTLQRKTSSDKVTGNYQWIRKSGQKQAHKRLITGTPSETGGRKGDNSILPGILQPLVSRTKAQQQMETHPRFKSAELLPSNLIFQDGDTRDHPTLSSKGEWVTSLDFNDAYFHIPIGQRSRKFLRFFLHSQAYQFTALPFGLSTAPLEFTKVAKEVKLMAQARGIRIHQYLDDWLLRAPCPETCLLHTRTLLHLCHRLGWVVNMTKSELGPQQVFNFVGYRFDLSQGLVKPTQERWIVLSQKISDLLNQQVCLVRQFMSLIGLLTATEKQVVARRLHMRPIQWHLKRHWHVPESLEKIIPLPQSLHPHLRWWLNPGNVLKGQPLHPLQHALQLFTNASNEGWGAHLGDFTARGLWSTQESALHINLLELKAMLLALKRFERLCWNQTILVCSDNTTVVSYINKEGGMKSGSLCALLWRLLMWCNQRQIVLRARHIPGHLNVIADKLSRHGQVIQTEWSLLQEVFD